MLFATVSLSVLTFQSLCKYAEKKIYTSFHPNSPCCHANITTENTIYAASSLFYRRQPGIHKHFLCQLPSPWLHPRKRASDQTHFCCGINTTRCTIPPTRRELHFPFRTARRLFELSRIENRSRQKPHCTTPYDSRKEARKTLYYG